MFNIETDRHPGRRIWFGSFQDTVAGLEIRARVKLKPRMLRVSPERLVRVDIQEILYIEQDEDGKAQWHTVRGSFHDLDTPTFEEALEKARRTGVFVKISPYHAIAPTRILGIQLKRTGFHLLELEGQQGEPVYLAVEPRRLPDLEECLDAINLGGGFLITGPDDI